MPVYIFTKPAALRSTGSAGQGFRLNIHVIAYSVGSEEFAIVCVYQHVAVHFKLSVMKIMQCLSRQRSLKRNTVQICYPIPNFLILSLKCLKITAV